VIKKQNFKRPTIPEHFEQFAVSLNDQFANRKCLQPHFPGRDPTSAVENAPTGVATDPGRSLGDSPTGQL
jgi:hypothetical protein